MCKEYINIQTKEIIDKEIVYKLKDNAMLKHRIELFEQWNFEKNSNLGLDVYKITQGSGKKAWWVCSHEHEWQTAVHHRAGDRKQDCPYCSGNKVLKGFNDLWTTHPEVARNLWDTNDGYLYSQGSDQKVNWKCRECKSIIKNKVIHSVMRQGVYCTSCRDGMSFGEKVIYSLLEQNNIEFMNDVAMEWSGRKRYDFYLPTQNTIIEVNGKQHYEEMSGSWQDGGGLEYEMKNDAFKMKIAMDNGIEEYIVLDARESTIDWMENSVRHSKLLDFLETMRFDVALNFTSKSFLIMSCKLWEDGMELKDIQEKLHLSESAVRAHLRKGTKLNLCSYGQEEEYEKRRKEQGIKMKKPVVQLTSDGDFIREWDSATDASRNMNVLARGIASVCTDKRQHAGGFKWMHKDKYDALTKN